MVFTFNTSHSCNQILKGIQGIEKSTDCSYFFVFVPYSLTFHKACLQHLFHINLHCSFKTIVSEYKKRNPNGKYLSTCLIMSNPSK